MTGNFKSLGLALVAALAISAMVASLASADEFQSESEGITLVGAQEKHLEGGIEKNDQFTTSGGVLQCTTVSYSGSQSSKKASSLSVKPAYSGCTFAGLSAEVQTNGCEFVYTFVEATTNGEEQLKCPAGEEVTFYDGPASTRRCVIHIGAQKIGGIEGVIFANLGSGPTLEVRISVNAGKVKYAQTAGTGTGACSTVDLGENGTDRKGLRMTASVGGKHVSIFAS